MTGGEGGWIGSETWECSRGEKIERPCCVEDACLARSGFGGIVRRRRPTPVNRWSDGSWVYHTGDGNGREDASRKDVGERVRVVCRGCLVACPARQGRLGRFVEPCSWGREGR